MKTYRDKVKCHIGHKFVKHRRASSAGKIVLTYCPMCERTYLLQAGPLPRQYVPNGDG
jgi:hypothetical protein